MALTCWGVYSLPPRVTFSLVPILRLMDETVFSGLVMAWRLATWPTRRSPVLVKPTTEGVVRAPSALGMTTGSPPSITATQLLVVPRSIPMILLIIKAPLSKLGVISVYGVTALGGKRDGSHLWGPFRARRASGAAYSATTTVAWRTILSPSL